MGGYTKAGDACPLYPLYWPYTGGAECNHKVYEVDWILNVLNAETKPIQGVGKGVLPQNPKEDKHHTPRSAWSAPGHV